MPRYVAFDVHKSYVMVAAIDQQQQIVLTPRKVRLAQFDDWCAGHLQPDDQVVLEVTTNAWDFHDRLHPLVARVVVAHPYHIKLIASSSVKTDKRDTLVLARLLAADMVPEVWVPPMHVRELRGLMAHYHRLVSQQTAARNRIQSVLHRNNLIPPKGGLFTVSNRDWWDTVSLKAVDRLRVKHDLETLDHLAQQIQQAKKAIAHESIADAWLGEVPLLLQIPGIGLIHAMTLLGAIGDVSRFPSAKKLVGYAGLGGRVHASGKTYWTGKITKQGRRDLRTTMVEAAWTAVRYSPIWKSRFEELENRIGQMKAITAIARKLLVVVWHVLTKGESDHNVTATDIERTLMSWSTRYRLAHQLGMKRMVFVHQCMRQFDVQPPEHRPWHQPT